MNKNKLGIITTIVIIVVIAISFLGKNNKNNISSNTTSNTNKNIAIKEYESIKSNLNENGDVIIETSDISYEPKFYNFSIDGTYMEVIVLKAKDGEVRTAFNTCNVCKGSGKGYYIYKNGAFTCQNCGNKFTSEDIGKVNTGCNPVPILDTNRTINDAQINISKNYLTTKKSIFKNWKI